MTKRISAAIAIISMLTFIQCKKSDHLQELKNISKNRGDRVKAEQLSRKAMEAHKKKNYLESEKLWYQAARADPSWGKIYFNLACTTALQGKKEASLQYLQLALDQDIKLLAPARGDADLKSLRNESEYKRIIKEFRDKNTNEAVKEKYKDIFGYWVMLFDGEPNAAINLTLQSDGNMSFFKQREIYVDEGSWEFNPQKNAFEVWGDSVQASDYDGSEIRNRFTGTVTYDEETKKISLEIYLDGKFDEKVVMQKSKQ